MTLKNLSILSRANEGWEVRKVYFDFYVSYMHHLYLFKYLDVNILLYLYNIVGHICHIFISTLCRVFGYNTFYNREVCYIFSIMFFYLLVQCIIIVFISFSTTNVKHSVKSNCTRDWSYVLNLLIFQTYLELNRLRTTHRKFSILQNR